MGLRIEDLAPIPAPERPVPKGFKVGFVDGLTNEVYQRESNFKDMPPALSQSTASTLDKKSPRHAWAYHPKLGGVRRTPTDSLDMGNIIHDLVLGGGNIVEIEADSFRTKAAKQARDAAREQGATPVKTEVLEVARVAANAVKAQLREANIQIDEMRREVSMYWVEWVDDRPVQCRGRVDGVLVQGDRATILDLKTCRSAHPDMCQKHVDSYGYAIQHAAYVSAVSKICGVPSENVDFVFGFAELTEPIMVTPVRLDPAFKEVGQKRWERAVRVWERCLRTDEWPGYGSVTLSPPQWAYVREFERDADEEEDAAQ